MKTLKFYVMLLLVLTIAKGVDAQNENKPKGTYLNLNYMMAKMGTIDSEYSAGLTVGNTFYVHKNPIANMIRFGVDWSFLDLNFAQFGVDYKSYKAEAGMHIGPSVTVSPVKNLHLSAYARFAPCYSALYYDNDEEFSGAYASFFVAGTSVSYNVISLGIESRWGTTSYDLGDCEISGVRLYLGFRF